MANDRIKLQDEISAQFEKGGVLTASDEKLQEYLMSLASGHVPNDMVRHREIIRALTINYLQMKRHINNLNKRNSFTQYCVIALTVMSLIGSGVQIWYAKKADQKSALSQQLETQQPIEAKSITSKTETVVNKSLPLSVPQKHQNAPKNDVSR